MKLMLIIVFSLLVIFLAYFIYLSFKSQQGQAAGLIDQRLSPCPDTPNCINSEFDNTTAHYFPPIPYQEQDTETLISRILSAIKESGGIITEQQDSYIAATYSSKLFRYIDDFEVRIDKAGQKIHIRSASRVGRSDFGINRKRAEQFTSLLQRQYH